MPARIVGHRYFAIWNDTIVHDESMVGTLASAESDLAVSDLPVSPAPVCLVLAPD